MSGAAHPPRAAVPRITYLVPRRVDANVGCQRYFVLALEQVADVRIRPAPPWPWPFRRPEQNVRAIHHMRLLCDRSGLAPLPEGPVTRMLGMLIAATTGHLVGTRLPWRLSRTPG